MMPSRWSDFRRRARRLWDMRGTPLWSSLKRRGLLRRSRRISGVQRSAKISAALATGQNCRYPLMCIDSHGCGSISTSFFVLAGMVGRGADGIDASRLVAPAAGAYPVDGQHARRQRGYLVVPMREGTATEGRATRAVDRVQEGQD